VQSEDKLQNSSYINEIISKKCMFEGSIIDNVSELLSHILDCNEDICVSNIDLLQYILGISSEKIDSTYEGRITSFYNKLSFNQTQINHAKSIIKKLYENNSSKEILEDLIYARIKKCIDNPFNWWDSIFGGISFPEYSECNKCTKDNCALYLYKSYRGFIENSILIDNALLSVTNKIRILIYLDIRITKIGKLIAIEAIRRRSKGSKVKSLLNKLYNQGKSTTPTQLMDSISYKNQKLEDGDLEDDDDLEEGLEGDLDLEEGLEEDDGDDLEDDDDDLEDDDLEDDDLEEKEKEKEKEDEEEKVGGAEGDEDDLDLEDEEDEDEDEDDDLDLEDDDLDLDLEEDDEDEEDDDDDLDLDLEEDDDDEEEEEILDDLIEDNARGVLYSTPKDVTPQTNLLCKGIFKELYNDKMITVEMWKNLIQNSECEEAINDYFD